MNSRKIRTQTQRGRDSSWHMVDEKVLLMIKMPDSRGKRHSLSPRELGAKNFKGVIPSTANIEDEF